MIGLNNLSYKKGAKHRKMRLGLGNASGKGRSCTKGQKGQTSRSGNTRKESGEGGQMPLQRRIPKSGFSNVKFMRRFECVNLDRLNKFPAGSEITPKILKEKRMVDCDNRVKILGNGELKSSVKITAHAFSAGAKKKIEAAGGTAILIEIKKTLHSKQLKLALAKKAKPKTEKKTEVKVEKKPAPKVEEKAEKKTEVKIEKKPEPKIEKNTEPKAEKKVEKKAEKKAVEKVEKKAETNVEEKPKKENKEV